ncbi:MAG TPA: ThiF family adenylyltransferase [Mycobacterium sp.]|nr:ThiF family adenylyltransferase [Mycobacterium sp.]
MLPLVPPAAALTTAELARYGRQVILPELGDIGQRRLKNARVLVVGAGGLGSPTLLYLAAAGVGTLGIVDDDVVEVSNLQRQVIHGTSDVGRPKARSARDSIAELNPLVAVRVHESRLTSANAVELFGDYDLIIDGSDNFATRYLVNDAAVLAHKPYVWGSVLGFSGQVSVFWEDAPAGPAGECRAVNYRDLYPAPPLGPVPSCAEGGVLGLVCASVASIMGTEAVKVITGIGEPLLGRLMIYDALTMTYRTIAIRKDPQAAPIAGLADDGQETAVAEAGGITPHELHDLLAGGAPVVLVDVREPAEWEINRIDGAVLIPAAALETDAGRALIAAEGIPVLYCKTGVRSAAARAALVRAGFSGARHLRGGIVAWARQFDADMAMY